MNILYFCGFWGRPFGVNAGMNGQGEKGDTAFQSPKTMQQVCEKVIKMIKALCTWSSTTRHSQQVLCSRCGFVGARLK